VSVCLDSWAILAWLDGEEPALSRVEELIDSRPVVSWVNLVEVYYRLERDHGRDRADETLTELRAKLAPDLPGTARMIDAARLKARAPIALADCFAATTAAADSCCSPAIPSCSSSTIRRAILRTCERPERQLRYLWATASALGG
jgi:predicted nucleic acid-binding protein